MIKYLIHYRVPFLKEEMFCVMAESKDAAIKKSHQIIKTKCDVCFECYIECVEFDEILNAETFY